MTPHVTPPVPSSRPRLPDVFPTFAYLYGPADPTYHVSIQEADRWWRAPKAVPGVDVLIWGRLARNARPSPSEVPKAAARELRIAGLRSTGPEGMRLVELHRLPAVQRPGRFRGPVRGAILGGALAVMVRGARPARVIDAVVSTAGALSLGSGLRPSGDGSALATLPMPSGLAELRIARVGHPKSDRRGYTALQALEAAGVPLVPRPVDHGVTAGAGWSLETRLPGGHTARLTTDLLGEISEVLLRLPEDRRSPTATDDHIADACRAFPQHAEALAAAGAAVRRWSAAMPSVLVHGDLWLNNVLVADGHLSGIFDWDTWHPAGLPGSDLLNLLAAEERTSSRRDIGQLLIDDHWRSAEVLDVLRPAFAARGRALPDAAGLAALGVGWWASRVAAALDRGWRPTDQPAWVARNVELPLGRIARLERELG
jgi:hypothetical protein